MTQTSETARPRLGLRGRGGVAFAVLAFVLSASMALLTYQLARNYLLEQRESLAVRQAALNAQAVKDSLRARDPDVTALLQRLPGSSDSHPVLRRRAEWFAIEIAFGREALPPGMIATVEEGNAARQRAVVQGDISFVVGIPLPTVDAAYFEIMPLDELPRTLSTLGWSLFAAASITSALGIAVGFWASRRVLRPMRGFAAAAEEISAGNLDTRLPPDDRDLAPIAASFNEMADSLQQRIEREARFASDVTHELRTPLTALSAAVEVLARRTDDERAQRAIDVLRAQVRRFEQLVLDLLEISRFDVGAAELNAEPADPAELVRSVLRSIERSSIPVELAPEVPRKLRLDKRRVERMLANLVENADRYAGGPTRIEVRYLDTRLRIAVEDAGPGVAPDEQEAIFERFHRSAATAVDGDRGTGLGLALVAEHAALHGGRAWVENRAGGGARFVIELAEAP
jgi:signal transduction histidine kinase